MKIRRYIIIILGILVCSTATVSGQQTAGDDLKSAIGLYEDGEYIKSIETMNQLLAKTKNPLVQAEAYRYIAYAKVILGLSNEAKQSFEKAMALNKNFTVDTLATPPSITVVYHQILMEREIAAQTVRTEHLLKQNRRRTGWGVSLLIGGIAGLGGSGVCGYLSWSNYRSYLDVKKSDQPAMDRFYTDHLTFLSAAVGTGIIGAVLVPVSVVMLSKREKITPPAVSLHVIPGGIAVGYRF